MIIFDPVILVLPRGDIPIGLEVVNGLKNPLDLVTIRKLGLPCQPELAAAAVENVDDVEFVNIAWRH